MLITDKTWSLFARKIASPADPTDYNQEAVDRLMDRMEKHVVRVTGVRPQFHARNVCQLIRFQSQADADYYHSAWDRYMLEKAKIEGQEGLSAAQSRMMILVQFLKFRQAAELIRAPYLAKAMWESVVKDNKAAVCAANFRQTITRTCQILMNDYNIPRDKISLIWGGSQVSQTKRGKLKQKIQSVEGLEALLKANGIDLASINLGEDVEVKEEVHFDPALRMGSQNREARQHEIDQFQRGESLYCFFTFKAGGVGLSLHHTDELLEFKCRRKESGYIVEEDIPLVSTRPRRVFLAPTYSAIELVQGLGRCPRLTSMSDTEQTLLFFYGTIEERVKAITDMKLRCLGRVVRMRDHWEDIAIRKDVEQFVKEIEDKTPSITEDEAELLGGDVGDSDVEEEGE